MPYPKSRDGLFGFQLRDIVNGTTLKLSFPSQYGRPLVNCSQPHDVCKSYDTAVYKSSEDFFAFPGDTSFQANPAVEMAYNQLRASSNHVNAVNEDLTLSNLAILCLPVVMSIPPISLYSVPDSVVLWYTLATDIMATLPLLIKALSLSTRIECTRSLKSMEALLNGMGLVTGF